MLMKLFLVLFCQFPVIQNMDPSCFTGYEKEESLCVTTFRVDPFLPDDVDCSEGDAVGGG
jgi:hypothetical protein